MTTFVPLLSKDQIAELPERARDVVEYRKSGLSLNHIQSCPLGCTYCCAENPKRLNPPRVTVNPPYRTREQEFRRHRTGAVHTGYPTPPDGMVLRCPH